MTTHTILATTSSFGELDETPIQLLRSRGFEFVSNPFKRKLSEDEIQDLLVHHRPVGLLAGLEPLTNRVMSGANSFLKVISRVGVGVDNVDLDSASRNRIRVVKTEDVLTPAVAEFTVGLIFALSRNIPLLDRKLRSGSWPKNQGLLIGGKTVGVVGFGRIGRRVAQLMAALGSHVQAYDPLISDERFLQEKVKRINTLECIAQTSDILTIHLPLTPETRGIFGAGLLSKCKQNMLLINTSRGELIDEEALYTCLSTNQIRGAAIDVFAQEPYHGPLTGLDNTVLTPHVASYAEEIRREMELLAVNNLLGELENL